MLQIGKVDHREECLLEWIANRGSYIHYLLKAFFDQLWYFQGMINQLANADADPAQPTADAWIRQKIVRKQPVKDLK